MSRKKIDISGGTDPLSQNPFAALNSSGLPDAPKEAPKEAPKAAPRGKRATVGAGARIEIRREKSGRGGKLVTTLSGFPPPVRGRMQDWSKEMKNRFGCGGTVAGDTLELQGDRREAAAEFLEDLGFRPVFAGG